ncbi:TPA: AAA family ATPase [Vibrio parahaemolyticus]|uniref:AAA family ATPase n=2 Tax=Vibrio harveyi group TaxID=717610 RepID=UPI001869876D|nr:AAA family ATPase [Vibrio alginolyticus]MBE4266515.1 ATP-binding protein [Vibrio parahaemolyticus]MBE4415857.1 ATP-binding protein [Vibrio parahaemolyticus]MCG6334028.1 AAA family ATPase [Vibrio alginolyticus]MCG6339233.1 AAA family ATPase [Vibrio alginolyticus]MCG6393813.1 AAA family ATPase [Vibrio alginolyticus]
MKFHITGLGKIPEAKIELNDLTIICGPNSSSKTWLSYSIYHYLNSFHTSNIGMAFGLTGYKVNWSDTTSEINIYGDEFQSFLDSYLNQRHNIALSTIHRTFNVSPSVFSETRIETDIFNEYKKHITNKLYSSGFDIGIFNKYTVSKIEDSDIIHVSQNMDEEPNLNYSFSECVNILLSAAIQDEGDDNNSPYRPFVITSERVGSLVFQKDIDGTALSIKDALEDVNERFMGDPQIESIIRELSQLTVGHRANLAIPVRKNLLAVRNAESELKKESYLKEFFPNVTEALIQIVKGKFSFEAGTLTFTASDGSHQLPITITSSSIKSLFMIDLYINSLAKEGDVLLIDEPELNLHPDNQRLMAKVIARIANSGIKVLITTHSDYLIREINNFIMLSQNFDEKEQIMNEYNLSAYDILKPSQVNAYSVSNTGEFSEMDMLDTGIDSRIFDDIIIDANKLQGHLFEALEL